MVGLLEFQFSGLRLADWTMEFGVLCLGFGV